MDMNTSNRRRMAGVTLLELMAVVMVIGILGIIALPSYRQYVMRAQRTEAKTALLRLQTNQERFYLANRRYGATADLAALGFRYRPDGERLVPAGDSPVQTSRTRTQPRPRPWPARVST